MVIFCDFILLLIIHCVAFNTKDNRGFTTTGKQILVNEVKCGKSSLLIFLIYKVFIIYTACFILVYYELQI